MKRERAVSGRVIPERLDEHVAELASRPYRIVIKGAEGSGFLAEASELPGCFATGVSETEALERLRHAIRAWIRTALENGDTVPESKPDQEPQFSGRMLVRMPRSLHRDLARWADEEGVSMNQLVVTTLGRSLGGHRPYWLESSPSQYT